MIYTSASVPLPALFCCICTLCLPVTSLLLIPCKHCQLAFRRVFWATLRRVVVLDSQMLPGELNALGVVLPPGVSAQAFIRQLLSRGHLRVAASSLELMPHVEVLMTGEGHAERAASPPQLMLAKVHLCQPWLAISLTAVSLCVPLSSRFIAYLHSSLPSLCSLGAAPQPEDPACLACCRTLAWIARNKGIADVSRRLAAPMAQQQLYARGVLTALRDSNCPAPAAWLARAESLECSGGEVTILYRFRDDAPAALHGSRRWRRLCVQVGPEAVIVKVINDGKPAAVEMP